MKVILAIFFLGLLATSSAVTFKAKSKAILKSLAENSDSGSSYRAIFKSLLTLTDGDEYQQVYDILTTVLNEILDVLASTNQRLADENDSYASQLQNLEQTISDVESARDGAQSERDSKSDQRDSTDQIIQDTGKALSDAVSARDTERDRRQNAAQTAQDNIKSIQDAQSQCDIAVSILTEVGNEDLPAQGGSASFLETRKKRVYNSLVEVGSKIKKIKTRGPAFPLFESLISIAQGTVNQDDIQAVIALVLDLKASLGDELQNVKDSDDADAQSSANLVQSLSDAISAAQTILTTKQGELDNLNDAIDNLDKQIASLKETLDKTTDTLNKLDEAHGIRASALQALIDRLTADVAAINQALSFLNSQTSS